MAISEYSRKNINFKPDLKQEQYLLSLSSGERSQFIREAINEKITQKDLQQVFEDLHQELREEESNSAIGGLGWLYVVRRFKEAINEKINKDSK